MTAVRLMQPEDHDWVLALNETNVVLLAPMDDALLNRLYAAAFRSTVIGKEAFVLTFDQNGDYDSPNFLWFKARRPTFAYVDRIVISESARGKGLGRALYEDVFDAARKAGLASVVCEINLDPPNPGSDAFHAQLGFEEIGRAVLPSGKGVRYLECVL